MSELHFDVTGADGPKQYFSRLTKSSIAHGYLFTGPSGVGKKTFARALAQSLLCEAPHPNGVLGYEGTCRSCKLIAGKSSRHPDLLENEGTLKIGQSDEAAGFAESESVTSRDIVRQLSLQSYGGGLRILILGDVDFASAAAANALLKFFEEPPEGVILLLTAASASIVIPTIRSRLVEIRFPVLTPAQIEAILVRRGYSGERARLGATLAQGSVKRAISALEQEEEQLRAQVGRWFLQAARGDVPVETWATRETLEEGLEVLKTLVRDWVALSHAGPEAPLLAVDYARETNALRKLPAESAQAVLARIGEAQRLARTNVSPALIGELVRMALAPTSTA